MRRPPARRPDFDRLECKELLATGTGTLPPPALTYAHNFLPAVDAQLLQTGASNKNLEVFAARLAQLTSARAEVQQYANQVILDNMAGELQGGLLAVNKDVILPPDLIGQDVTIARQLLAAVGGGFDQAFLTTMAQINAAAIATGAQLATTTADADVRTYAQEGVTVDQTHLAGATNLLNGVASGIGTGTPPAATNPATVTTGDADYLQASHSSNNFEIFTSQIAQLVSTDTDVQQYALKLMFDHTVADHKAMQLANANGVSLAPTLAADAAATARALLATANSQAYDAAYLAAQVPMHQKTQQADIQEAATTQNPNLRDYARTDIPTTAIHILAARQITSTRPNAILPPGANSQNFRVRVGRVNRFTYTLTARLNAGGLSYNSTTRIRFPRRLAGNALPRPTNAQIRTALFNSLNNFLNGIADSSSTDAGMGTGTGGPA